MQLADADAVVGTAPNRDALLAAALAYLDQSTPVESLPAILKQVDAVLTAIAEAQDPAAFADEYRR